MRSTAIAAAIALGLFAGAAQAASIQYHAVLNGASEVPPVKTEGSGELFATLNTETRELSYTLTFSGLTGPATAAHFHGPAKSGVNATPVVTINLQGQGPIHATATLTEAQMKELMDGQWYVNVHTPTNKGGEIRGQVGR